jgi:hypothetical protein
MEALFAIFVLIVVVFLSFAFQRTVSVNAGGMSSFHVSIVALAPVTYFPGFAGEQPVGVIVHPTHGSSNP